MSNPFPPRYLPTLTEVVTPIPVQPPAMPVLHATPLTSLALTEDVLKKITPLVERTLREVAHAQLDDHLNTLLPTLQGSIEAAVQQALQQTLLQSMVDSAVPTPGSCLTKESR